MKYDITIPSKLCRFLKVQKRHPGIVFLHFSENSHVKNAVFNNIKTERKRIVKKSKKMAALEMRLNQDRIAEIFSVTSSYWGMDKVDTYLYTIDSINRQKLVAAARENRTRCKITRNTEYNDSILADIQRVEITEASLTLSMGVKTEVLGRHYCHITLTSPEGTNVATASCVMMQQRILAAVKHIYDDYGIRLDPTHVEYNTMEIAYTVCCSQPLPTRVMISIMHSFSRKGKTLTIHGPSDGHKIETVQVKNTRAKKTCTYHILYDKAAELVASKKLPKDFDLHIYRFEARIQTSDSLKTIFGKKAVFGTNALRDDDILQYIKELVKTMYHCYCKNFIESIEYIKKMLYDPSAIRKPGWIANSIAQLSNDELRKGGPWILDAESFAYVSEGGASGARIIHAIYDHLFKQHSILTDQHGRMLETLLRDMNSAADRTTLGPLVDESSTDIHELDLLDGIHSEESLMDHYKSCLKRKNHFNELRLTYENTENLKKTKKISS